jgi:hypothetical protein
MDAIQAQVALTMSSDSVSTAGVLLITLVLVEWGGLVVLRIARGQQPATDFQRRFARAGHAHAGVLVVLSLVVQIYADAAGQSGLLDAVSRLGVPVAAILFPLGFFLSSAGAGRTEPSRLIILLYAGAVSLAAGVLSLGIGLLLSAG